jgi:uncharacterized phage protein (predicted DNA packaging)
MAQTNALPEDATLLELYADAAEEQIEVDINRPLTELIPEGGDSYPKKIKLAVLLLVGHWYRNREAFSTVEMKEVPKTYNTLVASFRDFAKPYRQ